MWRGKLKHGDSKCTKPLLKPWRKLKLTQTCVVPRLASKIVSQIITKGGLTELGIGYWIKRWLRLPHDVNNHFFYTATRDGGSRIQELATSMPLLQHANLEAYLHSSDPTINRMGKNLDFSGDLQKILKRFELEGVATSKRKQRAVPQQHRKE